MKVKIKRVSSLARVPTKSTLGTVSYNVDSARDVVLGPGVTKPVKLDLNVPKNTFVESIQDQACL